MKKFFIGLFVGLIAIFGSIASVGSKASFNNFNEFKSVKNALKDYDGEVIVYFDNRSSFIPSNETPVHEGKIFDIGGNEIYYYNNTNEEINISTEILQALEISNFNDTYVQFFWNNSFKGFSLFNNNTGNDFTLIQYRSNGFYYKNTDILVNAFYFFNTSNVDEQQLNETITPYIGNLTSLPSEEPEEPTPPPEVDSMESSIGNVIRGIIDWFVDIFNGLADVFVITDSTGQFIGFSVWGQVLFIEVGIGLVMIVLKWVISLIRGV